MDDTTKEAIKEIIRDNLTIETEKEYGGYGDSSDYVNISIMFDGECISTDSINLG